MSMDNNPEIIYSIRSISNSLDSIANSLRELCMTARHLVSDDTVKSENSTTNDCMDFFTQSSTIHTNKQT